MRSRPSFLVPALPDGWEQLCFGEVLLSPVALPAARHSTRTRVISITVSVCVPINAFGTETTPVSETE